MEETDRRQTVQAELLLLVCVLFWAANYPVSKYGIGGIDRFVFNGLRYALAAATLGVTFRIRSAWTPVDRGDWLKLLRAGVVANFLYQVAFIIGLSLTTAGNAAIILATAPLWTVILGARLHRDRISTSVWIGMFLSLCGIAMIIIGSGTKVEFGSAQLVGDLVSLGAAMLWGLNTNLQKPLLHRYAPLQVTLCMVTTGAVGLSVIAIPSALTMSWGSVHWTYYAAVVGSGFLSIALANVVWSTGVKRLGPSRTANFGNLIPVFAFLFSALLLDEQLVPIQFIGAAVTIAGVWYARRR